MISKKFQCLLSIYLHYSSYFHSNPWNVEYNRKTGIVQLSLRETTKSNLFWLLNILCQLETVAFSFFRLIPQIVYGKYSSLDSYVMHCFNIIGWGIPVYYSGFIILYRNEMTTLFNQTVELDHHLREKYFRKRKTMSILELGFTVVLPSCYAQGISFVLFGLFRPDLPFFHCSLFKELGWPIWTQIPIKIYESFMLINCWNVIAPIWLIFLTPGCSIFAWTHELPRKKHGYCTFDSIRKHKNSLKVFRYVQLLSIRLLSPVKDYLLGVSFFIGSLVVVMMGYATVRELGETPMPQYLAYPTSWMFVVLIFTFVGTEAERWNVSSVTYIRDLKCSPNKILKRERRSLWPMVLKISDVQSATKGFTVSKINHALDAIADLLLSSE